MVCFFLVNCSMVPVALKKEEILDRMTKDSEVMYKGQEPITEPLSLEDIMSRSLKYNLDHRIKLMENALSLKQLDLLQYDMLPRVVAAAGYNSRDRYNSASSMNIITEQESLAQSTSQDKNHFNADLTMTWNILDFGVSYFQARQQADRTLIMAERRRKVVHTIMQQARHAYWLAVAAQEMQPQLVLLLLDVEQALKSARVIEEEKLRSPLEMLTYRKTLLEILKQLESFRDELNQARTRLALLINLAPGQQMKLVVPKSMIVPKLPESLTQMENRALLVRPELLEADYNERISANEVKKSIARMLPGIDLTSGLHFDSNSFLMWNTWFDGGVRVTWNLLNLLSGPLQYKIATAQKDMAKAQRLALSMAVLTQVHLSYHDFLSRERQYDLSKQLQEIETGIHLQTRNLLASGAQNRLIEIRAATSSMMAEFRSWQNYASLQNGYGQIIATLGVDPLPETVENHDVKTIARAIKTHMDKAWEPVPAIYKPDPSLVTGAAVVAIREVGIKVIDPSPGVKKEPVKDAAKAPGQVTGSAAVPAAAAGKAVAADANEAESASPALDSKTLAPKIAPDP